jgi:hypothetical protein
MRCERLPSRRAAEPAIIEGRDIFHAAKLLIDQHGDDAAFRAAQRTEELLKDGEVDGSAVWGRILVPLHRGFDGLLVAGV